VEDPSERGMGVTRAKEFFPDEILDYDPLDIATPDSSAFESFRREKSGETEKPKPATAISR
jgi:hypothetical protein